MPDMISELYYGNIQPHDKSFAKGSNEAKLMQTISDNEDWLTEHLDGQAKSHLLNLIDAQNELTAQMAYEGFRDGFLLGTKLMAEIWFSPQEEGD